MRRRPILRRIRSGKQSPVPSADPPRAGDSSKSHPSEKPAPSLSDSDRERLDRVDSLEQQLEESESRLVETESRLARTEEALEETGQRFRETLDRLQRSEERFEASEQRLEQSLLRIENRESARQQAKAKTESTIATEAKRRRRPASLLRVVLAAVATALVFGFALFFAIDEARWRSALAELRAEPGIEVFAVERTGLQRRRLLGLRDPLAPDPGEILARHRIPAEAVELHLVPHSSLGTPYAEQRAEEDRDHIENLHETLTRLVADLADKLEKQSDEDFEKLSKLVIEARFPEEASALDIRFRRGVWTVKGDLSEPSHTEFTAHLPDLLVRGRLDLAGLTNRTEEKTAAIREIVEGIDLFQEDFEGRLVHRDRLARLLVDYDDLCRAAGRPLPRFRIQIPAKRKEHLAAPLEQLKRHLADEAGIEPERFLPETDLAQEENPDRTGSLILEDSPNRL